MVMNFPAQLTEEEEILLKKYAKLKKKKKALAALKTQKSEPAPQQADPTKRSSEEAANATEQAKKLLKLGAIKVGVEKKEHTGFKRSKRLKETDKSIVGFTPFAATHNEGEEEKEEKMEEEIEKRPERLDREKVPSAEQERVLGERERTPGDRERGTGERERRPRPPKFKGLYDNFVSSKPSGSGTNTERRDRERKDSEHERDVPRKGNTVYVYGPGITEDLISKHFTNIGTIVNISMEPEKNCAFVSFDRMESADEAIAQMHGIMVGGIQLKVSMARRQPTFESNPDPSGSSWSSIAASHSQKGSHKDKRDLVTYDVEDIF